MALRSFSFGVVGYELRKLCLPRWLLVSRRLQMAESPDSKQRGRFHYFFAFFGFFGFLGFLDFSGFFAFLAAGEGSLSAMNRA